MATFTAGQRITAAFMNSAFQERRTLITLADQTATSGTTLINSAYLTFTVAVNSVYRLETELFYTAGTTGDLKIQFTAPSGSFLRTSPWGQYASLSATDAAISHDGADNGGPWLFGGGGSSVMLTCRPVGSVSTAGTSGNCVLQFAQSTGDATNTILKAGSSMTLIKVA